MAISRVKCLLCSKEGSREAFQVIVLTPKEREIVSNPLDEYCYCKQCYNLLSHRVHGPAILSGVAQMHLTNLGVSNPYERASKFKEALVKAKTRS